MRIWGGYDLFEMDPTNGRVTLVVSSDYRERFLLRSALNHGATYVPPEVWPLKAVFCWHS